MNHSIWEILNGAGYALWAILVMSVLAVAVALERAIAQWNFTTRARALADTVTRCLARGALDEGRSACERSASPLADVFLVGYERLGRTSPEKVASAVHRERLRVASDLRKRLWILGTIGATAPFVGLFGTVVGIMYAFSDIADAGGGGLEVVAPGISEALYATAAGIFVAVEAVVIFNYFNTRLARVSLEMKMLSDEFLELLEEHAPEADRTGKPAAAKSESTTSEEGPDGNRSVA